MKLGNGRYQGFHCEFQLYFFVNLNLSKLQNSQSASQRSVREILRNDSTKYKFQLFLDFGFEKYQQGLLK